MKKILYLSSAAPYYLLDSIKVHQISNKSNSMQSISKFQNNFIKGMSENDVDITSLNAPPISRMCYDYIYFTSNKKKEGNINYHTISFVNFYIIKQLIIFIKFLFLSIFWACRNNDDEKVIIYDGAFRTIYYVICIIKLFFKNITITCVILDVYNYMGLNGYGNCKKSFINAMKSTDKFILITEQTNELINKENKPYIIVEGMVNIDDMDSPVSEVKNKIIYAGGIHKEYGVLNLANAFTEIKADVELLFYGNGEAIEAIEELTKRDKRIKYMGSIQNSELIKIESEALFLVNPRITEGSYTKYSFPSKLMEYLLSGRPVLTTKLAGIPEEYDKYFYYFSGNSVQSIKKDLEYMLSLNREVLSAAGEKGKQFVTLNKNKSVVGKKTVKFIYEK